MKQLIFSLLVFTAFSCGSGSEQEIQLSPEQKAVVLRDSALKMVKEQSGNEALSAAIALLDTALVLDPANKSIRMAKMNVYAMSKDHDGLFNSLVELDKSESNDPFTKLHLGMEYELHGDTANANACYQKSVDLFKVVLDTTNFKNDLKRNSFIMNLALASTLAGNADEDLLKDIKSDQSYATAINQFNAMSREDLLKIRRK